MAAGIIINNVVSESCALRACAKGAPVMASA